ncbi:MULTISPECIES: LITAF-like zinc ribbon domain-containing protein [unclassified Streptomyces]|jgi:hypothetical protein|uniref:LITAF-like zinc ribbon domain-containing protein n=1 Tax=unclassified Streptomyces TaxID=2593676 RepID=UPI001C21308F|nr:LITAF-like zinc ribbon domain-containing protein [Streptomyces sp. AC558_RSS880]
MDSERPVCPACGQPVETVVRRHKTLGAWVPVWVRGPCRNPRCKESHEAGESGRAERPGDTEAGPTRKDAVRQAPTRR